MSNCLFAFPNRLDSASLSGGDWETALPLTNLQNYRRSKVARSTDATVTNTQFDADLGSELYISVVALVGHNLSQAAQWRIQGGEDDTFATSDYDSGWLDVYGVVYPSGVLNFGDPGFIDGKIAATEYALGETIDPLVHVLSAPTAGQYWRIEIDDTANADGYVEIGRAWISYGYTPSINFATGAEIGWETSSSSVETDGGEMVHLDRPTRRTVNFTLPNIPTNEAFVRGFELTRRLGTTGQLFWVYDPADTYHMHRRAFLCTMRELNRIHIPYALWNEQGFQLREEI